MTSTLVNLDIEEMCFCLACALEKHLEYGLGSAEIEGKLDEKLDYIEEEG